MKRVHLFCLLYAAGGIAVYRVWQSHVPAWITVVAMNLPGRDARRRIGPIHQWSALLELLSRDVQPYLPQPFAIFGHSMGVLVGLELAYMLRAHYRVTPVWFGASGCI